MIHHTFHLFWAVSFTHAIIDKNLTMQDNEGPAFQDDVTPNDPAMVDNQKYTHTHIRAHEYTHTDESNQDRPKESVSRGIHVARPYASAYLCSTGEYLLSLSFVRSEAGVWHILNQRYHYSIAATTSFSAPCIIVPHFYFHQTNKTPHYWSPWVMNHRRNRLTRASFWQKKAHRLYKRLEGRLRTYTYLKFMSFFGSRGSSFSLQCFATASADTKYMFVSIARCAAPIRGVAASLD